jgi:hypothetical protein
MPIQLVNPMILKKSVHIQSNKSLKEIPIPPQLCPKPPEIGARLTQKAYLWREI